MIPLLKDISKANDDVANISISESLAGIFERIMLKKIDLLIEKDNKQFGFVSGSSCSHPVFVMSELIKYIKKKRKKCYITAIDASKAFDKVNKCNLWHSLLGKIGPELTGILRDYYSSIPVYVVNNCIKSRTF